MPEPSAQEIRDHLDEIVEKPPEPTSVTLSNFDVNWSNFTGTFDIAFDGTVIFNAKFDTDCAGRARYYKPMIHSPMGVAASYAAVEITYITDKAIRKALEATIPRLLGAGKPRKPDSWPSYDSNWCKYISEANLNAGKERVTPEYQITVDVQQK
ncbi:MAG: hypothetical protein ABJL54_16035 [Halioglobus sp.]